MYYLNLDDEGYLLGVSATDTGGPGVESLEGLDLSGYRIKAHRWDGEKIVLDEEILAALEKEEAREKVYARAEQLRAALRATDSDVVAAVARWFAAESVTDLFQRIIQSGQVIRNVLETRTALEDEIREMEAAL